MYPFWFLRSMLHESVNDFNLSLPLSLDFYIQCSSRLCQTHNGTVRYITIILIIIGDRWQVLAEQRRSHGVSPKRKKKNYFRPCPDSNPGSDGFRLIHIIFLGKSFLLRFCNTMVQHIQAPTTTNLDGNQSWRYKTERRKRQHKRKKKGMKGEDLPGYYPSTTHHP